jgi:hypothetical protein
VAKFPDILKKGICEGLCSTFIRRNQEQDLILALKSPEGKDYHYECVHCSYGSFVKNMEKHSVTASNPEDLSEIREEMALFNNKKNQI